ncbi:MAG: glucose-1-phosphate adenylyltransferase family protein [Actinomycetes bacterium]
MAPRRILVLVLAGGAGSRLELLTDHRAKPAVPYGGSYLLIDFPLSSCRHSGMRDVWIAQQQHPVSLADAVANGRAWDLDRTTGGLRMLPPAKGPDREGWHHGTADALWKEAQLVRGFAPEALVLVSADAVYRLDYDEVVDGHLASGAAVTMVTTRVDRADACRYGVVLPGDGDAVADYAYKPDVPASSVVTTEVFVLEPRRALDELERVMADLGGDDEQLGDLGDHLLPRLVAAGEAREHRFTGYWRDVGTVDAYWESHMDLLQPAPAFVLDDPDWPVLTTGARQPPARLRRGAHVADSLLAGGSDVAGTVDRSVLSSGVVVEKGAVVRRSVLLPGAVVRAGAIVERAVVDSGVRVGRDCRVGGPRGEVALVGHRVTLRKGTVVPPGGRRPDVDRD